jgi:hypothetical protein
MADDNLPAPAGPEVTTPPTYESQVEDISNLLGDPETDLPEESADDDAANAGPEDDPLGLEDEAEDVETDDSTDPDGPSDIKGGRFAPDSAKVKLETGETITIADLKGRVETRVRDFQRDYTEKTTALKAKETQVDQRAQSLDQFHEYAAWYAEQFLPKQPEPFKGDALNDPAGFIKWQQDMSQWQTHVQAWQAFQGQKEAETKRKTGDTQEQAKARYQREQAALVKAIPVLRDPVKGPAAWQALKAGAIQHYGMTEEEFNTIGDHRILIGLRDGLAYRRIQAKAPQVQAQVAQKPVMAGGKRAAPNARASREKQVRSERLRSGGDFDTGVAVLQDLL